MKHKHYDMIVAKAANMDLVVFTKAGNEWKAIEGWPDWLENFEWFLCHPKRKEVCLHWLNGGEIQMQRIGGEWENHVPFSEASDFVKGSFAYSTGEEIRIKPRTEKRYFATWGNATSDLYESKERLVSIFGERAYATFHEIEVEV